MTHFAMPFGSILTAPIFPATLLVSAHSYTTTSFSLIESRSSSKLYRSVVWQEGVEFDFTNSCPCQGRQVDSYI
jgi:hypothetical protein